MSTPDPTSGYTITGLPSAPDGLVRGRRYRIYDSGPLDCSKFTADYDYVEFIANEARLQKPFSVDFAGRLIHVQAIVDEAITGSPSFNLQPLIGTQIVDDGSVSVTSTKTVNTTIEGAAITDDNQVVPGDEVGFQVDSDAAATAGKLRLLFTFETDTATAGN